MSTLPTVRSLIISVLGHLENNIVDATCIGSTANRVDKTVVGVTKFNKDLVSVLVRALSVRPTSSENHKHHLQAKVFPRGPLEGMGVTC